MLKSEFQRIGQNELRNLPDVIYPTWGVPLLPFLLLLLLFPAAAADLLIATFAIATTGTAVSALSLLQLVLSPATTAISSLVRSPFPAARALATLAPTAYASAPTAAVLTLLVRNFAPTVLVGCRNTGG